MKARKKVTKYRKPIKINIGIIIFFIVFLYIIVTVLIYFSREHISIYEVVDAKMADNNTCQGIALREEMVFYARQNGYINYYIVEGSRVAKKEVVYTLDESGNISEQLADAASNADLSDTVRDEIKESVAEFRKMYSDQEFDQIYSFQNSINDKLLRLSGKEVVANLKNVLNQYGTKSTSFHINTSSGTGIVAYYVDSYEEKTKQEITAKDFDKKNYNRTDFYSSMLVDQGAPVYKLINSENWSIVLLLTKEQFEKLQEKETVTITFLKDGVQTKADSTVFQKGEDYFGILELHNHMIRYYKERFLDIEISFNYVSGLKIPNSSIVEKDFYKIPLEYFVSGETSSTNGLFKISYDEKGKPIQTYYSADIYYKDEEYGYISANENFTAGETIINAETQEQYQITLTDQLKGVYNVNKGYYYFRRVEVLYENNEYSIVDKNTTFGLSEYDHILLQGDMAKEQELIY